MLSSVCNNTERQIIELSCIHNHKRKLEEIHYFNIIITIDKHECYRGNKYIILSNMYNLFCFICIPIKINHSYLSYSSIIKTIENFTMFTLFCNVLFISSNSLCLKIENLKGIGEKLI